MAENTMDAIKKKMQAMRLEKETAFDRADQLEQRLLEQRYIFDQVQLASCVVSIRHGPITLGQFQLSNS